MGDSLEPCIDRIARARKTRIRRLAVLVALAVVVAIGVSWQLHDIGIAAANETFCGLDEHAHDDGCYEQMPVCGLDEDEGGHSHDEDCYGRVLVCDVPEHVHTVECLEDPNADDGGDDGKDGAAGGDADDAAISDAAPDEAESADAGSGGNEAAAPDAAAGAAPGEVAAADPDAPSGQPDARADAEGVADTLAADYLGNFSDGMGENLDGDYAYLTNVIMDKGSNENGYAMTTGTEPFDADDDAGNDRSAENDVLRTYDTATYTVDMTTNVREDAPCGTYREGDLYFELLVEGTGDEIEWDTSAMGWLESKNGVFHTAMEVHGGTCYQVLRGYVTLAPATDDGHAIGSTTQTLSLVLRVLAMRNEDVVSPEFTFFLACNDVGLTEDQYAAWGTERYDGPIVTFDGGDCGKDGHGREFQTVDAPQITVSAAPRYNLAIVNSSTTKTQAMGPYDFSTGNDLALGKDEGMRYGRLGSYGLVLQVVGKDASQGLRGVQLPTGDENLTVSFKTSLSSTYTSGTTVYQTGQVSNGCDLTRYAPLVWSFDQNSGASSQQDARSIPVTTKYADHVPFNKLSQGTWYNSCSDGGTWNMKANDDGTYTVTVADCTVDMGQLPYIYPGAGTSLSYEYYNPNNINYSPDDSTKNNYWEVQTACLSAGELWVVQPYYAGPKDDGTTYIAQMLGEGSYKVLASDAVLEVKQGDETILAGEEGTVNQAITTDDSASQSMALVNPGSIDQHVVYLKYNYKAYNDPLTDGCFNDGKDWILQGDKLTIGGYTTHDQAEEANTGVAYDELVKFDDVFFEPDGTVSFNGILNGETRTCLWAAKEDGAGWNHEDLSPDQDGYDAEMINATPDDLVYYSSLAALEGAGKTCVGVLIQYRGLLTEQQNHLHYYIRGSTKMTAETDQVYMVTHYARAWNRDSLAAAMAADPNSGYETGNDALNALLAMSLAEVDAEVNAYIPTRTADSSLKYEDDDGNALDYPACFWINGDRRHPTTATGGSSRTPNILNYEKTYYDANGCHEGTSGNYWGDSCLLVGYKSGLTMNVVQPTISGDGTTHNKSVFDMDTGQTVVDYVVAPFITRNNGEQTFGTVATTEVVVTVTLPENLTYIEGSSYIGGTYETNGEGKQGTVVDGTNLSGANGNTATFVYTVGGTEYTVGVRLSVTTDANGVQTLIYAFTGVPVTGFDEVQFLENIYYSCEISSGAVRNGQELDVTADIYCSSDRGIAPTARDDGEVVVGITVTKNTAVSLVKTADQAAVEVDGAIGFSMDVGDNSDNPMTMVAVDDLPYNGDGSSTFANSDCEVYATEFSAYDTTATRDLSVFRFFYTTNEANAGKTSADFPEGEYFVTDLGKDGEAINPACLADGWTEIVMRTSEDVRGHTVYTAANVPDDEPVYAIAAVGIVEGKDDVSLHVTLKLSDPEPGDSVLNKLTQQHAFATADDTGATTTTYDDLADSARSRVVSRSISGVVWLDEDVDGGIRTGIYAEEQLLSGVTVTLQTRDSGGNWATARKLKYDGGDADCVTVTDANGCYAFDYLPEGEYRIVFSGTGASGSLNYTLADHDATVKEAAGIDTSVNSKVGRSSGMDAITGITLPEPTAIMDDVYVVPYQNAGCTKIVPFTVSKLWKDVDGNDVTGSRTTGSVTAQVTVSDGGGTVLRGEEVTLDPGNNWTSTLDDLPYYDGTGRAFGYAASSFNVEEISGNEGYTVTVGDVARNGDGSYSVAVENRAGRELPNAGGRGTLPYTVAGLLLAGGAASRLVLRRRGRRGAEGVMPR